MSLTRDDLEQIRDIVRGVVRKESYDMLRNEGRAIIREEVRSVLSVEVSPRLNELSDRVEALENDVKEIYHMLPAGSA